MHQINLFPYQNAMSRRKYSGIIRTLFIGLTLISVATGCHSSKKAVTADKPSKPRYEVPQKIDMSEIKSEATERLLKEAQSWLGTSYRYGGNDRSGVDCSGFVTQVFNKALGIALPRTSRQQQEYCTDIKQSELQPGDLVFFTVRGGQNVGHVGIYVGQGNMIHSSSSRGVIISSLNNNYYRTNYFSSGRVEPYYAMVKPTSITVTDAPLAQNGKKSEVKTVTIHETARTVRTVASLPTDETRRSTPLRTVRIGGGTTVTPAAIPTATTTVSVAASAPGPDRTTVNEPAAVSGLESDSEFFD